MIALLKKDFGVYRAAIIGSALIILMVYIVAALTLVNNDSPVQFSDVVETFLTAGGIGLIISVVLAGMYGCGAFSLERRDRSADFLAMMPTTRGRIIASKAIVAIGCSVVIWLINLFIILYFLSLEPEGRNGNWHDLYVAGWLILGATVMFFGTAWLLSTFLNSAAISFGVGIALLLGSLTLIETWRRRHEISDLTAEQINCAWMFGMGILCFIVGVIYYLRRVEP